MALGRFLFKRSLQGVVVVWGVTVVVFLLRFITPGSPVNVIAPFDASPELRQQIAAELGLNQPIYTQYFQYLFGLLQGDMGYSYISSREASTVVFSRLPATLELAITGIVVAIIISIPLGVISATHRHKPADYGATIFSLLGISTPNFWLGVMLVLILGVQFDIFPTGQRPVGFIPAISSLIFQADTSAISQWTMHIILPAVTLGTYFTAQITRLTRSGMLDELGKSYINATRAKGLPKVLIKYRHALRNTLIPVITVLGLQLGTLVGGAVITETVFSWPGLGTLIVNAINTRDWPIIQGTLILIGAGFVIVNIAVDALYAYINPRVSYT